MKKLKAIIFDVDGTMVDSERYGHLPACNEAFEQLNLDIKWDWAYFKTLIHHIPGSANRLRDELKKRKYPMQSIESILARFEPLKKRLYIEKYLPELKIREGVIKLLEQAIQEKIILGIVSTSYEIQIKALLKAQFPQFEKSFQLVLGKESGQKTNNNGFLHKKALEIMQLSTDSVIMIEDSKEGLDAAVEAGIATAVFYNDYSFNQSFRKAHLVAPSLHFFSLQKLEDICLQNQ